MQIFVENMSVKSPGSRRGSWFELPVSMNELSKKIGLNDYNDEYSITDYEAPFPIRESESIDKLNQIAIQLEEMPDFIVKHIDVLTEEYYGSIYEVLNEWENISFVPGVTNDKLFGEYLTDEGYIKVPKELEFYVDYEALGRDWSINENILYMDDGMFWLR